MKRIFLLITLVLFASVQMVSAGGGKHKKQREADGAAVKGMHPKAERNHHKTLKEKKGGRSKAPLVKGASRENTGGNSKAPLVKKAGHEPKSGHSKAPKVKKPKKGKNYTKHDNYP